MTDLTFYDAAVPPPNPPQTDGIAFYIGGDAAHVWTLAEIQATKARYRLPIFVRSDPSAANADLDAAEAARALTSIGAPRGSLVAWDTETAADPAYMTTVCRLITGYGYALIDYGSQSALFGNELPPEAYYWGADWTGRQAVLPGDSGTQYAEDGEYDLDVFKAGLPFWDTHPGHIAPLSPITWQETMMQQLPTVLQGTTGNTVKTVQGLCVARGFTSLAIDGVFGPATDSTVRLIQTAARIIVDGKVGPQTWPALLGI